MRESEQGAAAAAFDHARKSYEKIASECTGASMMRGFLAAFVAAIHALRAHARRQSRTPDPRLS